MLEYNEIKTGKVIIHNDEPYEVLDYHIARTQQRKPQNQVKMRSLVNGRAVNETFHVSDKAHEADISKKETKFLYTNKGEYWFCDPKNPKDRYQIAGNTIGENTVKFLKENEIVSALVWNYDDEEKIINIEVPVKMEFVIKDCPPNIKGNTAQGGNKPATLENGSVVNVPLFLNPGDKILVNTQTGEYTERVS